MCFRWVQFNIEIFKVTGTNFSGLAFAYRERNRSRWSNSPILNIFIRFVDIRRRTSNSTKIGPNFACFWLLKFFGVCPPKF